MTSEGWIPKLSKPCISAILLSCLGPPGQGGSTCTFPSPTAEVPRPPGPTGCPSHCSLPGTSPGGALLSQRSHVSLRQQNSLELQPCLWGAGMVCSGSSAQRRGGFHSPPALGITHIGQQGRSPVPQGSSVELLQAKKKQSQKINKPQPNQNKQNHSPL